MKNVVHKATDFNTIQPGQTALFQTVKVFKCKKYYLNKIGVLQMSNKLLKPFSNP